VFKRKIKECPFDDGQGPVLTQGQTSPAEFEGFVIKGIRLRRVPVDMTGELVEQDDQGQSAPGSLSPMVILSAHGPVEVGFESITDQSVGLFHAPEPQPEPLRRYFFDPRELIEPEVQNSILGFHKYRIPLPDFVSLPLQTFP
jgi:hypothetical protein